MPPTSALAVSSNTSYHLPPEIYEAHAPSCLKLNHRYTVPLTPRRIIRLANYLFPSPPVPPPNSIPPAVLSAISNLSPHPPTPTTPVPLLTHFHQLLPSLVRLHTISQRILLRPHRPPASSLPSLSTFTDDIRALLAETQRLGGMAVQYASFLQALLTPPPSHTASPALAIRASFAASLTAALRVDPHLFITYDPSTHLPLRLISRVPSFLITDYNPTVSSSFPTRLGPLQLLYTLTPSPPPHTNPAIACDHVFPLPNAHMSYGYCHPNCQSTLTFRSDLSGPITGGSQCLGNNDTPISAYLRAHDFFNAHVLRLATTRSYTSRNRPFRPLIEWSHSGAPTPTVSRRCLTCNLILTTPTCPRCTAPTPTPSAPLPSTPPARIDTPTPTPPSPTVNSEPFTFFYASVNPTPNPGVYTHPHNAPSHFRHQCSLTGVLGTPLFDLTSPSPSLPREQPLQPLVRLRHRSPSPSAHPDFFVHLSLLPLFLLEYSGHVAPLHPFLLPFYLPRHNRFHRSPATHRLAIINELRNLNIHLVSPEEQVP